MLDQTDRKLLDLLQGNARLSNAELAEAVGLTISSVHERVKKLERRGIITGYVARVDAEKLGKPLTAFMRLTIETTTESGIDEVHARMFEACASDPDILECHNVAGEDCFIIKVRAEGPKQLERLLSKIRGMAKSSRSVTNIVLSTYKESSRIEPAPAPEADESI
ncbi:MAG TPA: Lrp/AsnC family transcriptional regulator [Rectinemataceae bacterium]|nr:Lrp/AsnC family transcriptional regulator [Rectinemataceae bacterium]